jgi:probable phosphoglycerate mutase
MMRKHKRGVIAVVVSEPLASIMRSCLQQNDVGDLWKSERDSGIWEIIDTTLSSEAPV